MITTTNDANLRMAARRRNLLLEKCRGGRPAVSNGYMIRNAFNGFIIAGERYQLSAEDVRDFLNKFDRGL